MRLTVLGSGDAFSGCGCNAGYVVDGSVLVDCGAPVHVLLRRLEMSVADLRLILLTHFHADHTFMLPMVLGSRAFAYPSQAGLLIAGPLGIREYVDRLVAAGWGKHIGDLLDERSSASFAALQDGSDVVLGEYRVRAHAVVHSTGPSLAYAVSDATGTTVGFSGDSTLCPGLERVIDQADLMVCECTAWDPSVAGGHLWSGQIEQLMRDHPRTPFLLSHLSERREMRGALIAHDLLTLDVQQRQRAG
jgi:ribonuclease Z